MASPDTSPSQLLPTYILRLANLLLLTPPEVVIFRELALEKSASLIGLANSGDVRARWAEQGTSYELIDYLAEIFDENFLVLMLALAQGDDEKVQTEATAIEKYLTNRTEMKTAQQRIKHVRAGGRY